MAPARNPLTVSGICNGYRRGSAWLRGLLREMYQGLRLEFDAIEVEEDRVRRMAGIAAQ